MQNLKTILMILLQIRNVQMHLIHLYLLFYKLSCYNKYLTQSDIWKLQIFWTLVIDAKNCCINGSKLLGGVNLWESLILYEGLKK